MKQAKEGGISDMETKTYLTRTKLQCLKKQLSYMENQGIKKLAKLLGNSPGSGMGRPLDLPIHDLARQFYSEIKSIREKLLTSVIIEEHLANIQDKNKIEIGAKVILQDLTSKNHEEYIILGSDEVNPREGKISYQSPLGKILIGKRKGDSVQLPNIEYQAEIVSITYEDYNFNYEIKDWDVLLRNG